MAYISIVELLGTASLMTAFKKQSGLFRRHYRFLAIIDILVHRASYEEKTPRSPSWRGKTHCLSAWTINSALKRGASLSLSVSIHNFRKHDYSLQPPAEM
jgi:hypothetical protein